MVAGTDAAPVSIDIVRTIARPIPRPCGLVVTNGENSLPMNPRQSLSRVAHRNIDVGAPDLGADRDVTPLGRSSAIASMAFITRFTNTCCKSTGSALRMQELQVV